MVVYAEGKEYLILSDLRRSNFNNSIWLKTKITYLNDKKTSLEDYLSLQDYNVINGGYNLHRLFLDKDYSKLYYELIKKVTYFIKENNKIRAYYHIKPTNGEIVDVESIINDIPFI